MTIQELDIDTFLSGPVVQATTEQGAHTDIDDAINEALAEIDQHDLNGLSNSNGNPNPELMLMQETEDLLQSCADQSMNINITPHYSLSFERQVLESSKPLSPQSLNSEGSQVTSPNSSMVGLSNQVLSVSFQEVEQMRLQIEKLQQLYDGKCCDLTKAMNELRQNEIKRLALMEENRALKNALIKATIDTSYIS